jgi:hypothetical protein
MGGSFPDVDDATPAGTAVATISGSAEAFILSSSFDAMMICL